MHFSTTAACTLLSLAAVSAAYQTEDSYVLKRDPYDGEADLDIREADPEALFPLIGLAGSLLGGRKGKRSLDDIYDSLSARDLEELGLDPRDADPEALLPLLGLGAKIGGGLLSSMGGSRKQRRSLDDIYGSISARDAEAYANAEAFAEADPKFNPLNILYVMSFSILTTQSSESS